MRCDEIRLLLDPLVDRELPANERDAVLAHLDDCPKCSRELSDLTSLRETLRSLPRPRTPPSLRQAITAAIDRQSASRSGRAKRPWIRPLLTHAAAVLAGGVLVVAVMSWPAPTSLTDDILAAHVRSLMDQRLTQVVAGDPHKVKPWFTGKLDYAPVVVDLAAQGFPLAGGRVDDLGDRDVAALVYTRRDHKINMFVIPDMKGDRPETKGDRMQTVTDSRNGFNIVGWRDQGFQFWAISDLAADELMTFAESIVDGTER